MSGKHKENIELVKSVAEQYLMPEHEHWIESVVHNFLDVLNGVGRAKGDLSGVGDSIEIHFQGTKYSLTATAIKNSYKHVSYLILKRHAIRFSAKSRIKEGSAKGGRGRSEKQKENLEVHRAQWLQWQEQPDLYSGPTAYDSDMHIRTGSALSTVRRHRSRFESEYS